MYSAVCAVSPIQRSGMYPERQADSRIYTRVRAKESLEKLQFGSLFNMHRQNIRLVAEETIRCKCGAEINEEVVYRTVP